MRQVRSSVFETNSSSTHSLTICSEEEFNNWKNGELLFDRYDECLVQNKFVFEMDKEASRDYYNTHKYTYYKDWEQLTEEEVNRWHESYAQMQKGKSEDSYRYQTYREWYDEYDDLERFHKNYTNPDGVKIIAFGKFGYN